MPHELLHSPPPPVGLLRLIEAELRKEANRQLQLLKEQALAKVAEIVNQVPYLTYTPLKDFQIDKEGIKELLLGYACVPPSSEVLEQIKNKAIGLVDEILAYQQPISDLLDRIHAKVESFLTGLVNFDNLFKILKPMQKIYSRIHIAIWITIQVAPLQFITGGAFSKLLELKKTFSRGNKILKAVIFAFQKAKEFLKDLIRNKLKVLLDKARSMLQRLVDFMNQIKTLIELYYLEYLGLCAGITFPPEGLEAQVNNLINGITSGFDLDDFFLSLLNNAADDALFLREVFNAKFEKIGQQVIAKNKLSYFLQLAESNVNLTNLDPSTILDSIEFPNIPNFPDVVPPLNATNLINNATSLGSNLMGQFNDNIGNNFNVDDFMTNTLNSGLPGIGINNIVNQYNVITNPINSIASNFNIGGGSGLPSIGGGGGY